jgi:hypothetical protein
MTLPFLQMEKHLPFNFPFASHYFYLQIFGGDGKEEGKNAAEEKGVKVLEQTRCHRQLLLAKETEKKFCSLSGPARLL